jgi:hypothetical protein
MMVFLLKSIGMASQAVLGGQDVGHHTAEKDTDLSNIVRKAVEHDRLYRLTVDAIIRASSLPNAFTMMTRAYSRIATKTRATAWKVAVTPRR